MGLGYYSKVVSTVYASPDLPSCRRHQKAPLGASSCSHGKASRGYASLGHSESDKSAAKKIGSGENCDPRLRFAHQEGWQLAGKMSIERAIDEHMMAKVARLRDMGFEDGVVSKAALEQVGGNVNLAVEKILSGAFVAPTKDEPRAPAAGGPAVIGNGSSTSIASIFNLSQRSVSIANQPVGGQKPRSRPTASTASKSARSLVRSATTSSTASRSVSLAYAHTRSTGLVGIPDWLDPRTQRSCDAEHKISLSHMCL